MARKHESSFLSELARRLKALREDRKLTLQEVYDATGVHIGRIESSKANVTLTTMVKLCRYYQVRLVDIVEGLDEME